MNYGISGIGYNPLGNIGLGMTGQYSSYDAYMPSMMGMGYAGMMNPTLGMTGMMGYYPAYMTQMQQAQNQIEMSQAQHNGAMAQIVLNNQVNGHQAVDSAIIRKMLANGDVKQGIENLYNKVVEGDQNGICEEFDKLKSYVLTTYKDEFNARGGKINPHVSATEYIEALYNNIITSRTGQNANLRHDIKRYGDNALENGFMRGFRSDHHTKYVDETLNHCFDLRIDHKGSKDMRQVLGNSLGRTASVLEKGALGAGLALTFTGIGAGLAKLFAPNKVQFFKFMKGAAWPTIAIGTAIGLAGDIVWQISKANKD